MFIKSLIEINPYVLLFSVDKGANFKQTVLTNYAIHIL